MCIGKEYDCNESLEIEDSEIRRPSRKKKATAKQQAKGEFFKFRGSSQLLTPGRQRKPRREDKETWKPKEENEADPVWGAWSKGKRLVIWFSRVRF